QDGLTDAQELALGTNPQSVDTDGDGQADLEELQSGHSPLVPQKELCDGLEL
ncbi:TPA: calcium-binding protein, partial [Streptococcus suis]